MTSNEINLEIVANDTVLHDVMDFKGIISRILSKNPDTFFINLHTGTAPAFVKQLRQAGFKGKFFGNFYLSRENEISAAGKENAEGGLVLLIKVDNPKYLEAHLAKYQEAGTVLDYACFVGASHLLQAAEKLIENKKDFTKENLHQEKLNLKEVRLFDQEIGVSNRWFEYNYEIKVIKEGKLVSK